MPAFISSVLYSSLFFLNAYPAIFLSGHGIEPSIMVSEEQNTKGSLRYSSADKMLKPNPEPSPSYFLTSVK